MPFRFQTRLLGSALSRIPSLHFPHAARFFSLPRQTSLTIASRANNDALLDPLNSPKLTRLGLDKTVHPVIGQGVTMSQWVQRRQTHGSGEINHEHDEKEKPRK